MRHISIFGHAIKLYISHNQKFSVIFLAAWIVLSCWHCQMKKMVLQWKTGPNGKFMSDNLQRMIPQWLCMRKLVIQLLFKIRLVVLYYGMQVKFGTYNFPLPYLSSHLHRYSENISGHKHEYIFQNNNRPIRSIEYIFYLVPYCHIWIMNIEYEL